MSYIHQKADILNARLDTAPAFICVVAGPRQVGKTTLVQQVLSSRPSNFLAADQISSDTRSLTLNAGEDTSTTSQWSPGAEPTPEWLVEVWGQARELARKLPEGQSFVLAIDEIQKVPRWSEVVKGLWDSDRSAGLNLHVILLGSSPWLMQKGLTESLAGRYELTPMNHWSYSEMREAFDFSLEEFIYFGGYPGTASLIRDEHRWREFVRASLIHPNIEKDILQMTRVDKPALLKNLFELGCMYSGQLISYTKLLGQLQDAGNTVTLAHYLELLSQAGLLCGIPKYAGQEHRKRSSSPKLNVLNTALMSALTGYTFDEARADRSYWGRLVESTVGAHLRNSSTDNLKVCYWKEGPNEVDFILQTPRKLMAIEVKSGPSFAKPRGLEIFVSKFKNAQGLVVGEGGIALAEFLSLPANEWLDYQDD